MTEVYVDDEPITVVFRNDRLTLYPLPLKVLKRLKTTEDKSQDETLDSIIQMITTSAQIGDGTVTVDRVEGLITAQNAPRVMSALMGVSGMDKAKEQGVAEGPPVVAPSTGAISTPESSPAPAGDTATLTN